MSIFNRLGIGRWRRGFSCDLLFLLHCVNVCVVFKCQTVHFALISMWERISNYCQRSTELSLSRTEIPQSQRYRQIYITFNCKLTFEHHIFHIISTTENPRLLLTWWQAWRRKVLLFCHYWWAKLHKGRNSQK